MSAVPRQPEPGPLACISQPSSAQANYLDESAGSIEENDAEPGMGEVSDGDFRKQIESDCGARERGEQPDGFYAFGGTGQLQNARAVETRQTNGEHECADVADIGKSFDGSAHTHHAHGECRSRAEQNSGRGVGEAGHELIGEEHGTRHAPVTPGISTVFALKVSVLRERDARSHSAEPASMETPEISQKTYITLRAAPGTMVKAGFTPSIQPATIMMIT